MKVERDHQNLESEYLRKNISVFVDLPKRRRIMTVKRDQEKSSDLCVCSDGDIFNVKGVIMYGL